jgi:hypothetical protein
MSNLQMLIDQTAIKDLHLRYCRGVDRMDWDLVRSCYHPDATDDHGGYKGGIDGFMDWVTPALARFESTQHFTGNQLVEVDGDMAWAEHYAIVTHRRRAAGAVAAADLVVGVRYVDRVERRDGAWRIAKRVVIVDFDRVDPVTETWLGGNNEPSRRDHRDYSYLR